LSILKQFFARPPVWVFVSVAAAAFLALLSTYVNVYVPGLGITKLIKIGQEFDRRGLATFRATPKYLGPSDRWGFDGQHYAQIALDPLLRDPQIKIAVDNPPYRARRILLPWLAWLGGLGRPAWILNVYAALNLVFWIGFAALLVPLFRPHGWAGFAGFAAMLMTCGIIESMHSSLTDFPAFVLMTLAVVAGGTRGAGVLALAALARETNIVGLVGLWDYRPPWRATLRRNLRFSLIAAIPMLLWFGYVAWRLRLSATVDAGNLDWPLRGIMEKLGEFSVKAGDGTISWDRWFHEFYTSEALHAVLTIVATLTQCIYLFVHREWDNRLWRVGALFAVFFLCIGFPAWQSHFTVTRHALPVTLAFNLLLAIRPRRAWAVWFLLGNCFVPYGIHLFLVEDGLNPLAQPECTVTSTLPSTPAVSVEFEGGWSGTELNWSHQWRWGTASQATLRVVNPTPRPLAAEFAFKTTSVTPRDLTITVRGAPVWSGHLSRGQQTVRTSGFLLPPGSTEVGFDSPQPPTSPSLKDDRSLTFLVKDLQLQLGAAP